MMSNTTPSQSPNCSCPSGNGSLRWPCPIHPPELAHAQHVLAAPAAGYNIFGKLTDSERATRAVHDSEVAAMAERLDEEMAIRTGCNGTPRADQRGTQEGDDMGTWGYIGLIAIVVGIAASWDWMRSRRMRRELEKEYETRRRVNERLQKRVDETIARGTRLTSTRWPAPPALATRPARPAPQAPSARPAPAVDEQSWSWPAPAFAASATDSAPARHHGGDDSHHRFSASGGSFDGGSSSGDWSSSASCSSSSSSDSGSSSCSSD